MINPNDESFYQDLQDGSPPLHHDLDFTLIEKGGSTDMALLPGESMLTQDPYLITYQYEKPYLKHHYCLYITTYRLLLQYTEMHPQKYRSIPFGYISTLERS